MAAERVSSHDNEPLSRSDAPSRLCTASFVVTVDVYHFLQLLLGHEACAFPLATSHWGWRWLRNWLWWRVFLFFCSSVLIVIVVRHVCQSLQQFLFGDEASRFAGLAATLLLWLLLLNFALLCKGHAVSITLRQRCLHLLFGDEACAFATSRFLRRLRWRIRALILKSILLLLLHKNGLNKLQVDQNLCRWLPLKRAISRMQLGGFGL
mmetsp:Transcript_62114/g.148139  ORF Transcript_62114/g.148139 Transcript_62114/m.148139 type:complete len:208 (-) Transcript_62114:225-848(-)